MTFTKNFLNTNICLTLVTGKMKDVSEGKITHEFVGLKVKDVFHEIY